MTCAASTSWIAWDGGASWRLPTTTRPRFEAFEVNDDIASIFDGSLLRAKANKKLLQDQLCVAFNDMVVAVKIIEKNHTASVELVKQELSAVTKGETNLLH